MKPVNGIKEMSLQSAANVTANAEADAGGRERDDAQDEEFRFVILRMSINVGSRVHECRLAQIVKAGSFTMAPPLRADSWAQSPTQVQFADCFAFGNGSRSSTNAIANSFARCG